MRLRQLSLLRKKIYLLKGKRNQWERIVLGRSPMVPASLLARRLRTGAPVVTIFPRRFTESRHRYVRRGRWIITAAGATGKIQKAMAAWVKVNKEIEKGYVRRTSALRVLAGGTAGRPE
jgi:hypothetical protein